MAAGAASRASCSLQLRLLSYNISGGNCSYFASHNLVEKHSLVAEEVLQHSPDVITLQEVDLHKPGMQQLETILGAAGFAREASAPSHCGHTAVYIHQNLVQQASTVKRLRVGPVAAVLLDLELGCRSNSPCNTEGRVVAAQGETEVGGASSQAATAGAGQCGQHVRLCLAGCHLEPFQDGAPTRLRQLEAFLAEAQRQQATHIVVAGDTNMRQAEDSSVMALGLQDAHYATGKQQQNSFTWDTTKRSRNYYYGLDTRNYTARYDRLYCSGRGIRVTDLQRVADRPHEAQLGGNVFLSDHFGFLCTMLMTA